MKIKKRRKSSRMHGRGRGTHGWGERKKHKKKGHRGGKGMAGTGKRADQKKTLVTKLYGHSYFGKQGVTSRKTQRDKRKRINIGEIQMNIEKYGKKTQKGWEVKLEGYKILGDGIVREKIIIYADAASESAVEKIKNASGEIILKTKEEKTGEVKKENEGKIEKGKSPSKK